MTDAGDYTYAHDPEGNTTARFEDVDTDGTLSTGDTNVTEYEWDHPNRLTRVITRATEGGAATQELQYLLNLRGYLDMTVGRNFSPASGKYDGKFGPSTDAAVVAFQTAKGLKADGVVGEGTWTVLLDY